MTIFTKIINREIPSYTIYEDELVIAFLDISQVTKGHTLVVPKVFYENLYDIDPETLKHLISVTQRIAICIKNEFNPQGINLLNNNEVMAGQSVFHFHMHIIPRYDETSLGTLFKNKNVTTVDEFKAIKNIFIKALQ